MRSAYRLRFAARRRLTFWLLRSRNEITRFAVKAKPQFRGWDFLSDEPIDIIFIAIEG